MSYVLHTDEDRHPAGTIEINESEWLGEIDVTFGGGTLHLNHPHAVTIGLHPSQARRLAANLLHHAGIAEAEYADPDYTHDLD